MALTHHPREFYSVEEAVSGTRVTYAAFLGRLGETSSLNREIESPYKITKAPDGLFPGEFNVEATCAWADNLAKTLTPARSSQQIWDAYNKEVLNQFDPHSTIVSKAESVNSVGVGYDYKEITLGLGFRKLDDEWVVSRVLASSPASRAKVHIGDVLRSARSMKLSCPEARTCSIETLAAILSGKMGKPVYLTFDGIDGESRSVQLIAERLRVPMVEPEWVAPNVLFVRVLSFYRGMDIELRQIVETTQNQHRAVILDLRNNPGGFIEVAQSILDGFTEENGPLFATQGREGGRSQTVFWPAREAGQWTQSPVVVLVNGLTASAPELLAFAGFSMGRFVVVGSEEPTYGKAVFTLPTELANGRTLILTHGILYGPNGQTIQGSPIGVPKHIRSFDIYDQARGARRQKAFAKGLPAELKRESELPHHIIPPLELSLDLMKASGFSAFRNPIESLLEMLPPNVMLSLTGAPAGTDTLLTVAIRIADLLAKRCKTYRVDSCQMVDPSKGYEFFAPTRG